MVHRPGRNHGNSDSLSCRLCEVGCSHYLRREVASCQRVRMEGRPGETSQRWKDAQHVDPDIALVLRWVEEGEQPPKEELSLESPATKALVEQWKTLRVQDGVLQKGRHRSACGCW